MRRGLTALDAAALEARVFDEFDRRLDPASAAPVALGLSGGSDSLALLGLASAWCARARRPLLALTVDHGLSPDAPRWSALAAAAAARAGAQWRGLEWRGPKPATGLPAAARAARHALLAEAARAAGACVVLLAHTADDVVEGELMRSADAPTLGRLRPWAPSPAWPQGRGVFLLRPLLEVGREPLRRRLRARGEAWIDDPANADARFARTRARAVLAEGRKAAPVSPLDPVAPDPAALDPATLHPISLDPVSLDLAVAELGRDVEADGSGRLAWPRRRLIAAGAAASARALAAACVCVGGGARPPRGEAVRAAARRLAQGEAFAVTLAGARIEAGDAQVAFTRAAPRGGPAAAAPLAPGETLVWDGRFEIAASVSGLAVAALTGHAASLRPGDRAALRAVPAAARPGLPVLVDAGGAPHLPAPFGGGPGRARDVAAARLHAACGAIGTEGQLAAAARLGAEA